MCVVKFVIFILSVYITSTSGLSGGDIIPNHVYEKMPKIFSYHDYDRCMASSVDLPKVYCTVRTLIKPDKTSLIWNIIEEFTRDDKRHFRHDALDRGICINSCIEIVKQMDNETQNGLFVDKFNVDFPYKLKDEWFDIDPEDRVKFDRIVNICMNKELQENFGLKAYSEVNSCNKSSEKVHIDKLDMIFVYIFSTIIFLVIASTVYDNILGQHKSSLLTSFSIFRNWTILISNSGDNLNQEFKFVQAFRFLTMCLVIFGHVMFSSSAIASSNPQELEQMYHTPLVGIFSNGTQIVQTFFFLSGMFLCLSFSKLISSKEGREMVNIKFILKVALNRYLRLTPVYAFLMLFHATWATKAFRGPFAKLGGDTEKLFCRKNGWTNLLYVNNYLKSDEPCFQHAWYMGTEFQLFMLGLLLMFLISKYYKYFWHIISISMILSYILPALAVYIHEFDGAVIISPESQRFMMWFHDYYHKLYIPLHVNIGNYLAGILFGLIYLNYSIQHKFFKSFVFKLIWKSLLIVIILTSIVTNVFYVNDYPKPSIWMSIFFAINKNLWGIFAIIFTVGILNGLGKKLRTVFSHHIFNILGRLTFSAFLCHSFILRCIFLNFRTLHHVCISNLLMITVSIIVLSYLGAVILNLILEIPLLLIQKACFKLKKD